MEKYNYTLNDVKRAINGIRDFNETRDVQALDEILPLVLVILKSKISEAIRPEGTQKYYAPNWVNILLERLSTEENTLSEDEYRAFRSEVKKLSVNDYKLSGVNLMSYRPVYTDIQTISEIVLALKHYFKLL